MQHRADGDGACLILFAGNLLLNAVTYIGIMNLLQGAALVASIIASIYVAIDHHKKIKWKKRQDKTAPKEREEMEQRIIRELQKHNDSGGHI